MLKRDFVASADEVKEFLKINGLDKISTREDGEKQGQQLFEISLNAYKEAAALSSNAKRLIVSIGGDFIFSSDFWFRYAQEKEPMISGILRSLIINSRAATQIANLLSSSIPNADENREMSDGFSIFFSTQTEKDETVSRYIESLTAIREVYEICCCVLQEDDTTLRIKQHESGSDSSFDFLGLAKATAEARKLLSQIFETFAFTKLDATSKEIKVSSEQLDAFKKLEILKSEGNIDDESYHMMKERIYALWPKVRAAGIYTEDMQRSLNVEAKQLMAPDTKLLEGPTAAAKDKPGATGA